MRVVNSVNERSLFTEFSKGLVAKVSSAHQSPTALSSSLDLTITSYPIPMCPATSFHSSVYWLQQMPGVRKGMNDTMQPHVMTNVSAQRREYNRSHHFQS